MIDAGSGRAATAPVTRRRLYTEIRLLIAAVWLGFISILYIKEWELGERVAR